MLEVTGLRKSFGNVTAVRDVSFAVAPGSAFGLLGPNGAGKTTTMRTIVGIYEPDGGTLRWNGGQLDARARRGFGYLPEERGLYGKMRVHEQIAYFARLHGMRGASSAQRAREWIERLQLSEYAERPCGELSKGNQQKVQMACAAVHGPDLLVLDEPFSGLDPVNAEALLRTLRELQNAGTALIVSSHQMWQLEQLCDAFCIIAGGQTRAAGTLAQLRAAWPTRVIRVEPSSEAVRRVLDAVTHARALPAQNGTAYYEIPAQTALPAVLRDLVAADAVTRFEAIEPSLQEMYLRAIEAEA